MHPIASSRECRRSVCCRHGPARRRCRRWSVMVPTSLKYTVGPVPIRSGASQQFLDVAAERGNSSTRILIKSPVRTLPDGSTVLARLTPKTTSSGGQSVLSQLIGIHLAPTIVPLAAAERRRRRKHPANVAKMGRTRFERDVLHFRHRARRAGKHQLGDRATLPASNRVMNGGTAPGGMNARGAISRSRRPRPSPDSYPSRDETRASSTLRPGCSWTRPCSMPVM